MGDARIAADMALEQAFAASAVRRPELGILHVNDLDVVASPRAAVRLQTTWADPVAAHG